MSNPADALFAAGIAKSIQEIHLDDYLGAHGLLDISEEDITWDYYDRSIEFHGVINNFQLDTVRLKLLWAYGFERCWINYIDGTQTYYDRSNS